MNVHDYITEQESAFKQPIHLEDGWWWNFRDHIRRSFLYKNSQFLKKNEDRDKRPYKNIIRPILNIQYRTEGFDVKDIELYSLCEHHILPFFGKAHIAYIPNGHIVGLSKIPRIVDVFARRLQVQERLTEQILDCINDTLKPLGVAVVIEASHMCMMMRGVQKQNSVTTTSGFKGAFKNIETRTEFLKLISQKLS